MGGAQMGRPGKQERNGEWNCRHMETEGGIA